jgi:hypothetical protein
MEPVGLAFKRRKKRYRVDSGGELMLVHHCTGCGALSINRIAADDLGEVVLEVYERSLERPAPAQGGIRGAAIEMLGPGSRKSVHRQLFGERIR